MTKNSTLAGKLRSGALTHAMAAHNPLAARLAERAGFDAIWGSGFELSASHAVPDASLLPMSAHLEMTRAISSAVAIPLIADIDTGFGNAVNVSYVVPQFESAGASAVVMEDKTFPKDTSLRAGGRQELVRVEEFQGKIAAACAARADRDFTVIARVEALIAGLGQAEAQRRARAYEEAGADAILIHSKAKTPDEILEFVRGWEGRAPLVLVPTAYPQLTERDIAALGKVA
ncbi:MAG: phosphonopyruvate hydrolase, partial [Usitatibacter sp.]